MLAGRIAATGPGGLRLARDPAGARMIAAIGGNSRYLADLAVREVRILRAFACFGADAVADRIIAAVRAANHTAPRNVIARQMREAKRRAGLVIALADISRAWPLDRVTGALSDLAEQTLDLCVCHLLHAAHVQGRLRLPNLERPAQDSGFAVLGMGKLGARELNYSSDIDLILLYDPKPYGDAEEIGTAFTRIARDLVTMMERRDQDGYVFRIDLRLRPDPSATPPAISLPAAIQYYESMGQNWDRAAMIKARPLAGDRGAGQRFLDQIKPFIWRRHLDFAAINDIAVMKRRIDSQQAPAIAGEADPVSRVLGHDVKLGEGGIREIEFMAQSLQMVWGGRDPALRDRQTIRTLENLTAAGHMEAALAAELSGSYRFLREVEHRIQMIDDRQTHRLPDQRAALGSLAAFLGFGSAAGLAGELLIHFTRVRAAFQEWFEQDAGVDAHDDFLVPHGDDGIVRTTAALRAMGFQAPARILSAVTNWRAGRPRALRSERARGLLDRLLPPMLHALSMQGEPDQAFGRFDTLLNALPAGVQILSLFERNPLLIERLANVLGAAPVLADYLARVPSALEGLLAPEEIDPDPEQALQLQLTGEVSLEDHIAIVRRFVRGERFRLSLAAIEGRIDVDQAGRARSALADAAMKSLLPPILASHEHRFGTIAGGGFAVLALGKAGGREMLPGSDLDLMLVYDHDPTAELSSGPKPLAPGPYFNRLANSFVAALSAPGQEGPLYPIDMRLRPSGNKGPVAVSLAAFRRYHQADAWTWERMALTRGRIISGPADLTDRLQAALTEVLVRPRDPGNLRFNATHMRARLARDLPPHGNWDVKLRRGGLVEVEFIAQTLQLIHAPQNPGLLAQNTCEALTRLNAAGLLQAEDFALLTRADRAFRTVQGLIRLMVPGSHPANLTIAAEAALKRELAPDLEGFITYLAEGVREAFTRLIGNPEDIIL